MHLNCTLWFAGASGKNICRQTQGVLSLGQHQTSKERKYYLVVSSQQNNHPNKIEIRNIIRIFQKMADKGKATIQFDQPPKLTLYISEASPTRLQAFLAQLQSTLDGKIPEKLEHAQYSSSSSAVNRQTKMRISSRRDYAKMNGFPRSLRTLSIDEIGLRYVDIRWFSLDSLRYLSVRDNTLGKEWTNREWRRFSAIARLEHLEELNLSGNPFKAIPDEFIDALPASLFFLRIANCQLTHLSNRISRLQKLILLDISNNPMEELPEDLCLLPHLCRLHLNRMHKLRFLPAPLFTKYNRFVEMDVTVNDHSPFAQQLPPTPKAKMLNDELPTLGMIAAAAVLNNARYLMQDGSRLLHPSVRDCLPLLVHRNMRQWLRRCTHCFTLFIPLVDNTAQADEFFFRIQLRSFIACSLYGPSPAYVRLQLCSSCLKNRRNSLLSLP